VFRDQDGDPQRWEDLHPKRDSHSRLLKLSGCR
jgi:hypothetical protein